MADATAAAGNTAGASSVAAEPAGDRSVGELAAARYQVDCLVDGQFPVGSLEAALTPADRPVAARPGGPLVDQRVV